MLRTLFATTIFALSTIAAHANALHLNPSQPKGEYNMLTFGRTTVPVGYNDYCKRYRDRCNRSAVAPSFELTRERWKKIINVNSQVNMSVAPLTDEQIFGVEEWWEYPKNVGDCEDYVLEKRRLLNDLGFPLGSLLITVARDANGGGHAVLTVVTDRGDFVLDNVEPDVKLWQDAELYYLKRQSQSNPNRWVSLVQK